MDKITKIVPIKDKMNERQKSMLASMKKDEKKNHDDFIDLIYLGFSGLQEVYDLRVEDFSNREFTLAFTKLNPLLIKEYNFLMFTKNYAKELVDQARLFSVDKVERGYYVSDKIINDDLNHIKKVIENKINDRIAYNKAVESYKLKKYNQINSSERER